ncbi:MAG TPA: gamma-glutamyltransferase [Candidatus Binatia bacterium]|jgi:gamma-glutamyltranspeptidase/glutathione hydrolase
MEKSFTAGRSMPVGLHGMVVSSQPLATQAGLEILKRGGNAIDASVCMAAMLNVVEPMSTGIGGDAFILIYLAESGEIKALNASGRAPYAATLDYFREKKIDAIPDGGMLPVTVPGALDGWALVTERYGTMRLSDLLQPAIGYAEDGFPVAEKAAHEWSKAREKLAAHPNSAAHYLANGRAPNAGEKFRQRNLAASLKKIAAEGKEVFYGGDLAEEIAKFSQANGGLLALKDFTDHTSTWVEPIKSNYRGYEVVEMPPNTQGMTVLEMLNMLERFDVRSLGFGSAAYVHALVEIKKLAFADRDRYLADPELAHVPVEKLISKSYAAERVKRIDPNRAGEYPPGLGAVSGDTQVFCAVDKDGNAVSFINSLFESFGCGLVGGNTGIMLHNRGKLFALDPAHPNCIAPHKRSQHTIMPAMVFKDGKPFLIFGVTGAHMQPQGQVQVLANLIDFGMPLQPAMDAPRVNHVEGFEVALEAGFEPGVLEELRRKAHKIVSEANFGGGQGILIHPEYGTLLGGSDPRKDGCALGY